MLKTKSALCIISLAGAIVTGNSHSHTHGENGHTHEHGHTHEVLDSPGKFIERDRPIYRSDWNQVCSVPIS